LFRLDGDEPSVTMADREDGDRFAASFPPDAGERLLDEPRLLGERLGDTTEGEAGELGSAPVGSLMPIPHARQRCKAYGALGAQGVARRDLCRPGECFRPRLVSPFGKFMFQVVFA
jgi:hypothetical protein